jgi:hypothetical protein
LTVKDLKKRVTLQTAHESKTLERLCNKPFWIWDIREHKKEDASTGRDCCLNHIIGLPIKERTEKPLFDYEKLVYVFYYLVIRISYKLLFASYKLLPR